jgi:hypothetical protein
MGQPQGQFQNSALLSQQAQNLLEEARNENRILEDNVATLKEQVIQRSLETRINLLYSIYPDRKHRFGIKKKWICRFKMVYFWLGDIVQIS